MPDSSDASADSVSSSPGEADADGLCVSLADAEGESVADWVSDGVAVRLGEGESDSGADSDSDGAAELVSLGDGEAASESDSDLLGERVGLGGDAVRDGRLAVIDPDGSGRSIEPSPPHEVRSKISRAPVAADPTGVRFVTTVTTSTPHSDFLASRRSCVRLADSVAQVSPACHRDRDGG